LKAPGSPPRRFLFAASMELPGSSGLYPARPFKPKNQFATLLEVTHEI
jgi:hypothetical protein